MPQLLMRDAQANW